MIKSLIDDFAFPGDGADDVPSFQFFHDAAVALGATCTHCASTTRKTKRMKAMRRGDNRSDVMARARKRRLALLQDVDVAVAEAESQ